VPQWSIDFGEHPTQEVRRRPLPRARMKKGLPERLSRLAFRLCFQGRRIRVEVDQQRVRYTLLQGASLDVSHHGATVTLVSDEPVTQTIPKPPSRRAPTQPPGRAPVRRQPK
jgi:alpha,alpha-trehalose phosphorylase